MNPYENEKLQNMPDMLLRPGGFELTNRLIEAAGLTAGSRLLDIGCGVGSAADYLAGLGYELTGIDKSSVLIERGRELFPDLNLITADGESLPFPDSSFEAVLFECTLSLMETAPVLFEARRVLNPGGWLLVSDVFARDGSVKSPAGMNAYTEEDFSGLLNKCGFTLTHFEDKTIVFESFAAQLIMSTGSLDALFDCAEWSEIKKLKPKYCIAAAWRI